MTLRIPAKVLIHVWSYDFYDISTGKQRRHMISTFSYNAKCLVLAKAHYENMPIDAIYIFFSFCKN